MDKRQITIKKDILNANREIACNIRGLLDKHQVRMINIMSSPGSGKTSLIMKTLDHFRDKYHIAVIEGDVASSIDADRITGMGIQAVQINTGGGCHLDALMIEKATGNIRLEQLDLIIVENVGNLVCTADFDLGAHKNVVILSIPEGDDKPHKYPLIFMEANIVLVNKIDVAPWFDFDLSSFPDVIRGLNPEAQLIAVSTKTGEGLDNWFSWVEGMLNNRGY
ncbi:MAG: hydrogenase nickel incorporation protein HypB [Deltaproteobacteria bacterium]|nr:hydrogenase nickel incorporation protein HypB [Deltaproteobacteria bacterium]